MRNRYHFLMAAESSEGFTLARGLNPTYRPNKILMLLLAALFILSVGWSLYQAEAIIQSLILGVVQILIVFLCWATARELDPDHDYAAFFGIPFLFHPLVFGQGNILILFWFLIALRILNQTTGKKVSTTDILFFIFLTLLAVILSAAVLLIVLAIVVVILSSLLSTNRSTDILLSLPLFPSFLLILLITPDAWTLLQPTLPNLVFISISSILLFLVTATTHEIRCTGDHSSHRLSIKRIQATQIIGLLSLLIISVFHDALFFVYPIWAAIIGIGVYRIISFILQRNRKLAV